MRTTADQLTDILDHWQSGTGPLYQQLCDAIVSLAEAGSLEHGAVLPSERALATTMHLSRNTVTAAYQQLRDQGWLEVKPGAAPRLGSRSRGAEAMSAQDRFSRILPGQGVPLVGLNSACPGPAPAVVDVMQDPANYFQGNASGSGYAALGDRDLVNAVVEHLRGQGIPAEPDELVITSGGQQAVWLAVTAVADASCPVAMEAITYPGVFDAVTAAGSRPLALPMTPAGLDVKQAARLLKAARSDVAYLTTYNNPTGRAMSDEDAEHMVAAARDTSTVLIDDRVLAELSLGDTRPKPLASFPDAGTVITIGGLSKVFWGGLRLGWLHTNGTLAAQLRHRRAAMDLGGPAVIQRLGTLLLTEHYDSTLKWRLNQLQESLAATREALVEAGVEWEFDEPDGGPSLWMKIPGGNGDRFAERADAAGAPVAPGSAFEVMPGLAADRFRLPFYLGADQMRLGVKILADRAA
jgi:DNA-binding transcriptional MocR family regulator